MSTFKAVIFSNRPLYLLYILLYFFPQILNIYQCPIASDMRAYFYLSQYSRLDVVEFVGSAFRFRVLPSYIAGTLDRFFDINVHITFCVLNIIATLLFFWFLRQVISLLLIRYFGQYPQKKQRYYTNLALFLSLFCFTFQTYFSYYIHPEPLALLATIIIFFCYLKNHKTSLVLILILSVFIKENAILFFSFIGFDMLFNKKSKDLFVFAPAVICYAFFKTCWYPQVATEVVPFHLQPSIFIHTLRSYSLSDYIEMFATVYGVFGSLWLIFILAWLKSIQSKKHVGFDLACILYLGLIILTSFSVSAKFRAFPYFLPFIIYYSVLLLKDSKHTLMVLIHVICFNLVVVFPYWYLRMFDHVQEFRTILSILVFIWSLGIVTVLIREMLQQGVLKRLRSH
ncbi:MAG: hypothetical protein VW378_04120 [bacterium]